MEYQGWYLEFSSTHWLDNSHVCVGSPHPLFVAACVVLVFTPYRAYYNMFRLYLCHLAFHRDDKTIFQFFEIHLHWLLLHLPVGIHCKYSSLVWTVLNLLAFTFLLTALAESLLEIACRAGRLSNEAKLFTHYSLLLTFYSLLVTRYFLLDTHCFLLVTRYFLLDTHCFLLVTRYFLLVTPYFLLVTLSYLLVTCCFLLVTRYFLGFTRYFLLVTHYHFLVTFYLLLVSFYALLVTLLFIRHYLLVTHYFLLVISVH